MRAEEEHFLRRAIQLARREMEQKQGGPFGALIVKEGRVVARGWNRVVADNDPSAHAEIVAIRSACRVLETFSLEGCTLYSSCEPCPMCLGAIYWARLEKLCFAATRADAAEIGFRDKFIYDEMYLAGEERALQTRTALRAEAREMMRAWASQSDRVQY